MAKWVIFVECSGLSHGVWNLKHKVAMPFFRNGKLASRAASHVPMSVGDYNHGG
jgi:hypothetical protein